MFLLPDFFREIFRIGTSRAPLRVRLDLLISSGIRSLGATGQRLDGMSRKTLLLLVDFFTWLKFRQPGLKKYQVLFVSPTDIQWGYLLAPPHHFGVVRKRFWDYQRVPVLEALGGTPARCVQRVKAGVSWEETGEIDFFVNRKMEKRSRAVHNRDLSEQISRRYEMLDEIIEELTRTKELRTRGEFEPNSFREKGGIGVVVNDRGVMSLCDGHHRFGIALALGLPVIPVALYAVHPGFVQSGDWRSFFARHGNRPPKL